MENTKTEESYIGSEIKPSKLMKVAGIFALSKMEHARDEWEKTKVLTNKEKRQFENRLCLTADDFWDIYLLGPIKPNELHPDDLPIYEAHIRDLGIKHLNSGMRIMLGDLIHADLFQQQFGMGRKIPADYLIDKTKHTDHVNLQRKLEAAETEMVKSVLLDQDIKFDYKTILEDMAYVLAMERTEFDNQKGIIVSLRLIADGIETDNPRKITDGCSAFHNAIHMGGGSILRMAMKPEQREKIADLLVKQSIETGNLSVRFAFVGASAKARHLFTNWAMVNDQQRLDQAHNNASDGEISDALLGSLKSSNATKIRDLPLLTAIIRENYQNDLIIPTLVNEYGVARLVDENRLLTEDTDMAIKIYSGNPGEDEKFVGYVSPDSEAHGFLLRYSQSPHAKYSIRFGKKLE